MALPKRRISHQRKSKRRSHHALQLKSLSICSNCGEPKLPHRVCKNCGYYGDKQVLKGEEE